MLATALAQSYAMEAIAMEDRMFLQSIHCGDALSVHLLCAILNLTAVAVGRASGGASRIIAVRRWNKLCAIFVYLL